MGLFNRRKPPVSVSFTSRASDPEQPDQTIELRNGTESGLRPVLRFVAHDFYGRELPNVEVGTVLGIDRGDVIALPGSTAKDVLHFHGQGARNVRGVAVHVEHIEEVDVAGATLPPEAVMVDLEERATLDPADFWGVGLVNRNEVPISVSVTLVEYEERLKDAPRQAVDAVTLEGVVDLASQSHEVLWLPEEVRGRFHAAFAHLVVPWAGPPEPGPAPEPDA
jgi:hypothetical protein